jgi:hypothetical protein
MLVKMDVEKTAVPYGNFYHLSEGTEKNCENLYTEIYFYMTRVERVLHKCDELIENLE